MRLWLLLIVALSFCAQAQTGQPVVLDDYPEFAATPPAQYQDKLKRIGIALAGWAETASGSEALQVDVVGHADFHASDGNADHEPMSVSVRRAQSASVAVQASFNAQADAMMLSDAKRKLVRFEPSGRGTSEALYPATAPMSQRVHNRRVVISWTPVGVIRPSGQPALERCVNVISASSSTPLRKKRISCACSLLRDNRNAGDDFFSLRLFQEALGTRNARDLSQAELTAVFSRAKRHWNPEVSQASRATTNKDFEFVKQLEFIDYSMIFEIDQFQRQFAVVPLLHDIVITAYIGAKTMDPNHVYSCYAGASMQDLDANR
jgi:hypothetical protein